MPRRKGQDAERSVMRERWNRWRIMLRNPEFQRDLNGLREEYRSWVKGCPIRVQLMEGDEIVFRNIERSQLDLGAQVPLPEQPIEQPWRDFEQKWNLNLPGQALSEELPHINAKTVAEWESLGHSGSTVIPQPVVVDTWWRTSSQLTLRLDLGFPRDVLLDRVDEEIKKAHLKVPGTGRKPLLPPERTRRRLDKLSFQLEVYDLYALGKRVPDIAVELQKSRSTVAAALKTAQKLVADPRKRLRRGGLKQAHIEQCPWCGPRKRFDSRNCPKIRKLRELERKRAESSYIPPLGVQGEKSALAPWESQHRR